MYCIASRCGSSLVFSLKGLGSTSGLLMTFMGFLNIAYSASDASAIASATAVMLLTILYGGLLASIGYFGAIGLLGLWTHYKKKQTRMVGNPSSSDFFAILFWVLGMVNGFEVFIGKIAPLGVFTANSPCSVDNQQKKCCSYSFLVISFECNDKHRDWSHLFLSGG